MGENLSTKLCISQVTWVKATILILGYVVVFGLGFAVGLHYAQNLYLPDMQSKRTQTFPGKLETVDGSLTYFYNLKETSRERTTRKEMNPPSTPKDAMSETKREVKQKDSKITNLEPSPSSGGYTIQVFSFKSRDISERMVAQLKDKGYPAYQSTTYLGSNGIYYRVRIGHFKNRSDAAQILENVLTRENKDAFITRD